MNKARKHWRSGLSNGGFLGLLMLAFFILVAIGFVIGPTKRTASRSILRNAPRQSGTTNNIPKRPGEPANEVEEQAPLVLGEPAEALPPIAFQEEETRPTGRLGNEHGETTFTDNSPTGGLLVGMRVVLDRNSRDQIAGLQPIYQVGAKYELGQAIGNQEGRAQQLLAKPGYAVGQINGVQGFGVDGIQIRFCRLSPNNLRTDDSYDSPWIGRQRGDRRTIGSGADFVVGVFGEADEHHINALGMRRIDSFQRSLVSAGAPLPTWSFEGSPTAAAATDQKEVETFRDTAPEGAVLVGMRVSVGRTFGESVQAVQPIYQVGDAYRFGKWCGTLGDNETVLMAKPGYVVSRINTHAGLVVDALQLVYTKVDGAMLMGVDSYDSVWVGGNGGHESSKRPESGLIVGIAGSSKDAIESLTYYVAETKSTLSDTPARVTAESQPIPAETSATSISAGDVPAVEAKDEKDEKVSKPSEPVRKWTSAGGTNTIEARLISMAQGQVVIETPKGRQIKVPLDKLSEADQKYVEDWRKRRQLGR